MIATSYAAQNNGSITYLLSMQHIETSGAPPNPQIASWQSWLNTPYGKIFFVLIFVTATLWQIVPDKLFPSIESYASLHIILESFSVIVAFMIFAICWYSPNQDTNTIAAAILFFIVALLDMFHFMSYVGMPAFGTENSANKSLLFWLAARYLSTIALLLFILSNQRQTISLPSKHTALFSALIISLGFSFFAAMHTDSFPVMFDNENGLSKTKIGLEYGLIATFLFLAVYVVKKSQSNPSSQDKGLFISALVLATSEFLFTLYGSLSDFAIFMGHVFKVFAYWIIFQSIFVSLIKRPYSQVQQSEQTLKRLAKILSLNRNESLYDAVGQLLYDKTQAEHVLLLGYDSKTRIEPSILSYYERGKYLRSNAPPIFYSQVIQHKLDRRNIIYRNDMEHNPLPEELPFKTFISYPLLSEKNGNVGAIIVASNKSFTLRQSLTETLFIVSTRLASELEEAIIELESRNRKKELARKLDTAREEERKTIARDIHDDLGGSLAALKIDISLLTKRLTKSKTEESTLDKLSSMNRVVEKSIQDMRNIINNLRLGILDDIGMIEAIEWRLKETEHRHNINTQFECELQTQEFDSWVEETSKVSLFRMISEAITNVIKHANAHNLKLKLFKEDEQLAVEITDDGQGMSEVTNKQGSYGIIGMQERTDLMGGSLSFSSPISGGTQINIRIPILTENNQ